MSKLNRRAIALAVGLLFSGDSDLLANEVVLKSASGSVELSGTLLGYDGEFYKIDTAFGEMTVRALGITCTGHACPDPGQYAADITISGDSAMIENLLPALIEDFGFSSGHKSLRSDHDAGGYSYFLSDRAQVPVARVQAQPGSSGKGFADLTSGLADLALASRPATGVEVTTASEAGAGDLTSRYQYQVLAVDALVFVVSKENPISSLSLSDIAKIYSGEITNWADLGGYDAQITPFRRNTGSDMASVFYHKFFTLQAPYMPIQGRAFTSDTELSDAVAADPFAIGFTSFSAIRNTKPLAIRGSCGIRQYPSRFGLQTGDYPLLRELYLFSARRRLPLFARNLMAYLDSFDGQTAIDDLGFVGRNLTWVPLADQQERLANAVRETDEDISLPALKGFVNVLSDASRLSATFRFEDDSTALNETSERHVKDLARMIEVGDFDGRQVIFAGFSDSVGAASVNRRISRQRAERVASLVKSAASRADLSKVNFRMIGMGEVSPIACNDTEAGRRSNRRVEVWVR